MNKKIESLKLVAPNHYGFYKILDDLGELDSDEILSEVELGLLGESYLVELSDRVSEAFRSIRVSNEKKTTASRNYYNARRRF